MSEAEFFVHETAIVEEGATVGEGSSVWHHAHVRSGAVVGANCVVGKSSYVDSGVILGDRVRIQNHVSIFTGVTIGSEVLVGPSVCFTNDLYPRVRTGDDVWEVTPTVVGNGVAIGANSTIVCGNELGDWCVVGAGTVVTNDVPPHALLTGNPGRVTGWVNRSGKVISRAAEPPAEGLDS